MRNLLVLSAIGLVGTRVAEAAPYPWCSAAKSTGDILDRALTDDDPDRAVPAIVDMLCFPDRDARAKQGALEARRQQFMKRLAMTEADWAADVVPWAQVPYSTRNTARVDPTSGVAWSAAGPVEQFAMLSMNTGDSSAFALQPGGKRYMADAMALGQAGRIALIADCIQTNTDKEVHPIRWAACQADIDALDPVKLGNELRGDSQRTSYDRMVVRIAYANLMPKLAAHATKVKALKGKDPAYGKMFEIGRATHAAWVKASGTPLLALVTSLDDARATRSRKAIAGCSEKAWPAFTAALAKLPASAFAHVQDDPNRRVLDQALGPILQDPETYLAANALVACEHGQDPTTETLARGLLSWHGFRGPRTATITKILLSDITLDDRDVQLEIPATRLALGIGSDWKNPGAGSASAVVSKVERSGDVVRVTFQKTSEVQSPCAEWRTTNRISMIDHTGHVHFEKVCAKRDTRRYDTTPAPITIATRYAAGLAPGVLIVAYGGVVVATWKTARAATPATVLGVELR